MDITRQMSMEEQLGYFRKIVENSPDAIGMSDPSGNHWYHNAAFLDLFGDIGKNPVAGLFVNKAIFNEIVAATRAGGEWSGEVEMVSRWGKTLTVLLRAYPIRNGQGENIGLVGNYRDITSQKETEQALQASEYSYRALVENSPDLLYRTDLNGVITFISASVDNLSGYTTEEAIGMKMAEEVYAIPEERQAFLDALRKNGFVRNFQARLVRKDGSIWWAATNAHFQKDADGNVIGVEGITRDITELKAAEAALKESEERFKIAGRLSYDFIYEWDVKSDSLVWFGDIDTFLGCENGSAADTIQSWLNHIHPEDRSQLEVSVDQHRTRSKPMSLEYRIKRADGSWRIWTDNALPFLDEANLPVK